MLSVNLEWWTGSIRPMYNAAHTCTHGNKKEIPVYKMECWLQENIINRHHFSILEFVDFHFHIKGLSRAASHQLVRHRLASYAQESQRSVPAYPSFEYVTPPLIENNPRLMKLYKSTMRSLSDIYNELTQNEIPEEDARFILPNACCTAIDMKVNGRQLLQMSHERMCGKAQWEIRLLFKKIQQLLDNDEYCPLIAHNMMPKCRFLGRCPEGEKSCRKPKGV